MTQNYKSFASDILAIPFRVSSIGSNYLLVIMSLNYINYGTKYEVFTGLKFNCRLVRSIRLGYLKPNNYILIICIRNDNLQL